MELIIRLLRGLPGSGKTTLAEKMKQQTGGRVFHLDELFAAEGTYLWTVELAEKAHHKNQRRVLAALCEQVSPIYIDACNIEPKEALPYVRMARFYKYKWTSLQPSTHWALDVNECVKRNVHGVSKNIILGMKKRMLDTSILFSNSMIHEKPMDPYDSLLSAQMALEKNDLTNAWEYVCDYNDWRARGGFEPPGGDTSHDQIASRIREKRQSTCD